jgi:hypothetical protein
MQYFEFSINERYVYHFELGSKIKMCFFALQNVFLLFCPPFEFAEQGNVAIMLWICILDANESNLGRHTGYLARFVVFSLTASKQVPRYNLH